MKLILQNAKNIEEIKEDIKDSELYLSKMPLYYKVLEDARNYITKQKNTYIGIKNKVLAYLKQGYIEVPSYLEKNIESPISEYKSFEWACDMKIESLKSYAREVQEKINNKKQLLKDLEKN